MSVQAHRSRLWSDEPHDVDLLAFSAVAETVIDAVLDEALDPVAIGISGAWGSGKTTVLRLVESGLRKRNLGPDKQLLIVPTDPWRYDPSVGAKETLIGEILDEIKNKLSEQETETTASKALALAKKLAKRIQWAKALKVATRTAVTSPTAQRGGPDRTDRGTGRRGRRRTPRPRPVPGRVQGADGVRRTQGRRAPRRAGG